MNRLSWLCILFAVMGCTESSVEEISVNTKKEYFATIESSNTKTYIDDQIRLRWSAQDCITLFEESTYAREYVFTGEAGDNAGGFTQKSIDDKYITEVQVPFTYAVYPHSSEIRLDETDYYLTVTMPSEQTYVENSFGLGANMMVAISETNQLHFKNVGSFLRVRLYSEDATISSITITSKGEEPIAGTARVTPNMNDNPTCEMIGSNKSIRLTCTNPVKISSDEDAPTDFWIVVPPVTLEDGFSVSVEKTDGKSQVYEVDGPFTFERNLYYNLKREVPQTEIPYLTFNADATQTLSMSMSVETLEYSVNGDEWAYLGTKTVTFGGNNGNLRIRGKNSKGTATNGSVTYAKFVFGTEASVSCSGDIRTLIDYENYKTTNTEYADFTYLFSGCKVLTSAPELPAMILKDGCYYGMFNRCTNLITAPSLPATNVTRYCYTSMFSECTSLVNAPEELPATTLATNCYDNMFWGCTSLTKAPKIKATTLARESCYQMFKGCTSLNKVPDLTISTLADDCCYHMFEGCTSLVTAPALPAESLAEDCYTGMFLNCTNLINAPALPATTLAEGCYNEMFRGCINLTTAPTLPAPTLVSSCYYGMFYGCSRLNSITMLAQNNFRVPDCTGNWLYEVASSGTFTKYSTLTCMNSYGSSGIPDGWTVKNYGE